MSDRSRHIAWESGLMGPEEEIEFFQELVDIGESADLPARYRRRLEDLIRRGDVFLDDGQGDDEGP